MGWNIFSSKTNQDLSLNLNPDYGSYNLLIHPFVPCNCDTHCLTTCWGGTSSAIFGPGEIAELRAGSPPSPVTEADGNRVREFSGPDFSREKEQKILQRGTSAIFLSWIYRVIQKYCFCDVWQWDLVMSVLGLWWTEWGSWGGITVRREMQGGEDMGGGQWFSSGALKKKKKKSKKFPKITANWLWSHLRRELFPPNNCNGET